MSTNPAKRVFVSAGEYSGSVYVASVVRELRKSHPELQFVGVGGDELKNAGVELLYNSDGWGSIGVVEALKRWHLVLVNYKIKSYLEENKPDLVILSDYPGFNMPLARKARELKIPSLYIFPPRKFAKDPASIQDAAQNIKRVAAEFEPTYEVYQKAGANVDFVGHPMVDSLPVLNRQQLRQDYSLKEDSQLVLLMPGSREQEIRLMLPVLKESALKMHGHSPNLKFHLLGAQNLLATQKSNFERVAKELSREGVDIELFWEKRFEHMVAADYAIVTSGTATLELSFYHVPMLICYRVTALTAFLARFFTRLPQFIGLPNLLSQKQIVPELIQEEANPDKICTLAIEQISNEEALKSIQEELSIAVKKLGKGGAIGRINELIEQELGL